MEDERESVISSCIFRPGWSIISENMESTKEKLLKFSQKLLP